MNLLRRSIAPVPDAAWETLESDARNALKEQLVARRIVDFDGPYGLQPRRRGLGSLAPVDLGPGVSAGLREVQPLFEVRVPFVVSAPCRGRRRARRPRLRHQRGRRGGAPAGGNRGPGRLPWPVSGGNPRSRREFAASGAVAGRGPAGVRRRDHARADGARRRGGRGSICPGARSTPYRRLAAGSATYPPLKHLTTLVSGPVLRSRTLDGGLLVSLRGGDFRLTVGQDAAIGYRRDDAERIELFFVESFTFLVLSPEAAVRLNV